MLINPLVYTILPFWKSRAYFYEGFRIGISVILTRVVGNTPILFTDLYFLKPITLRCWLSTLNKPLISRRKILERKHSCKFVHSNFFHCIWNWELFGLFIFQVGKHEFPPDWGGSRNTGSNIRIHFFVVIIAHPNPHNNRRSVPNRIVVPFIIGCTSFHCYIMT